MVLAGPSNGEAAGGACQPITAETRPLPLPLPLSPVPGTRGYSKGTRLKNITDGGPYDTTYLQVPSRLLEPVFTGMMIGSWVALGVLGATSRQELALELVNVADHPQAKCLDGNPPTPRAPHTKHRTCQACAESSSPLPNASADSPISRCTPLTCHATAIAPVLWGCGNVAVGTQSGSSPAFWFQAATNVTHANHWQIYFQGGGWCYSEADCWGRSKTTLGSSRGLPGTTTLGGIMGSDPETNPDFAGFNKVMLAYCEGPLPPRSLCYCTHSCRTPPRRGMGTVSSRCRCRAS